MTLVIVCVLVFDEELSQALSELRLLATGSDVPAIAGLPHVTLAAVPECNLSHIEAELESIAVAASRLSIQFPVVGTFPGDEGVVFLSPTPTQALLRLQRRVSDAFLHAGTRPGHWYRPGQWFPHCSLGVNLADPAVSLALVRGAMNGGLGGFAERLMLVDTTDGTPILEVSLSDGKAAS